MAKNLIFRLRFTRLRHNRSLMATLAVVVEKRTRARIRIMFGIFKKKPATGYVAAERTNLPLNEHMTRLIAEELPLLDSASRVRVYEILNNYEGETITTQEELPAEIRELMDL